MILRRDYIRIISEYIDVPLVKILAGVRRCGKSTVLEMIEEELIKRGIKNESIVKRSYNRIAYDDWTSKEMFYDLIKAVEGKGRCYLFLDEIQEISGWEKAINDIFENYDVDIYVTGSNSKLMSGEISTYLTGRYVSIHVYTLSFKEYINFKRKSEADRKELFDEYVKYGGFPIIGISDFDLKSAYQVVDGIYASVITRYITKRHKVRSEELFERVVKYIIENMGKPFSANSISKFLKSENRSVSVETVYNYLKWLTEAFIIYPCNRYDLQGKAVLKTQEKYYLSDISIKYAKMGFDVKMISAVLENIVYLEMKRRGYEVYVGKINSKEIDFVGISRGERIYIQVCDKLPDNSTREVDNLLLIKDHYRKYVVCRDNLAIGNKDGVEIINIADFLLKEQW